MNKDLKHADITIKLALSVLVILPRAFGFISGPIADAFFVLALVVLIYYIVRVLFTWMLRD